ncbi:MAG: MFS transporter [Verrucomicrobiota bacterium]
MTEETPEVEPTRRQWVGFWSMIVQQTQNAFNDKFAQFTLIPLGGAVGFVFLIPVGKGIQVDVPSVAGLMIALPFVLFAPLAGWVSDRFSKRDVMLAAAIAQVVILAEICFAVMAHNMHLALWGFFALAVQSAFFSPAKIGINKELLGSKHLGFSAGIQQMTAMLAILAGQIVAGWWFDHRYSSLGGGAEMGWKAALAPLILLGVLSVPALGMALAIPRVPAQGGTKFSAKLAVSHFLNLADLWRDRPLRRASFGVAFFWGFAAFINLWSVKLAQMLTGGGEGFGTLSSVFMAAASLGMAGGFGLASWLLRKRIELGWVPLAGLLMTASAVALAFLSPSGWPFLILLGLLAFFSAVFLSPLNAWMQDRYPAAKRGELQSAVNLQNCFAGIIAVLLIAAMEYGARRFNISPEMMFRLEIAIIGLVCGAVSLFIVRLLPGDFIRLIGLAVIRSIYQIRSVGTDNVPKKGGALLLPNHVTFADAFFITAASPRPVRFVMDEAFMANRVIRFFVSIFDTVTIRQDQPLEAIRITIDALKKGDLVCLFPEGQLTRTGTLGELRGGFRLIARKAKHPLIPMACDGSWGSIFSFERGKFFNKLPYRVPFGMTLAFGPEIDADDLGLEQVRQAMFKAAAAAQEARFSDSGWGQRVPRGNPEAIRKFQLASAEARRRIWINGHQIGQINALQRRQPFEVLGESLALAELPGLQLAFPELFHALMREQNTFQPNQSAVWVGGDRLRNALSSASITAEITFYDFGENALEPLDLRHVTHLPCLAVDGVVIAMSMPDPPLSSEDSEPQLGHKPGSWGKLLPGWFLIESPPGVLRAHGPAAPEVGLPLPEACSLDAEGFLVRGHP